MTSNSTPTGVCAFGNLTDEELREMEAEVKRIMAKPVMMFSGGYIVTERGEVMGEVYSTESQTSPCGPTYYCEKDGDTFIWTTDGVCQSHAGYDATVCCDTIDEAYRIVN